jgi:hypothetical protein
VRSGSGSAAARATLASPGPCTHMHHICSTYILHTCGYARGVGHARAHPHAPRIYVCVCVLCLYTRFASIKTPLGCVTQLYAGWLTTARVADALLFLLYPSYYGQREGCVRAGSSAARPLEGCPVQTRWLADCRPRRRRPRTAHVLSGSGADRRSCGGRRRCFSCVCRLSVVSMRREAGDQLPPRQSSPASVYVAVCLRIAVWYATSSVLSISYATACMGMHGRAWDWGGASVLSMLLHTMACGIRGGGKGW